MTIEPDKPVASVSRLPKYWLFGGAVVLGVLVAGLLVLNLYRGRNSLNAERLAAARAAWDSAGIRNYDIWIQVTGRTSGVYFIGVRNDRPAQASMNGTPTENVKWADYWTVDGLFGVLEDELRRVAEPSAPKCHTEVEFDPRLGFPRRFVRSSQGENTIVEVTLVPK